MPSKQTKKPTRSSAVKRPGTRHAAHSIALRPTWEKRLKELEAFEKEHGHCNVPKKYSPNSSLGNWVSYVRSQQHSGAICPELARRLDGLGFTWVLRRRSDWDAMVAALIAFRKEHGHCCVPWQPAKYRTLAMWLSNVRRQKKNGLLDRGRIRQLDELGVVWEPNDQEWEERFAELVAYRAKYGNCNVPSYWSENPRLASWVHHQRYVRKLSTLTQDRLERLDKIGFVWDLREQRWESMFTALVEYKKSHGNCDVPVGWSPNPTLAAWINRQRRLDTTGTLLPYRRKQLEALGVPFSYQRTVSESSEESRQGSRTTLGRIGSRMPSASARPFSLRLLWQQIRQLRSKRK